MELIINWFDKAIPIIWSFLSKYSLAQHDVIDSSQPIFILHQGNSVQAMQASKRMISAHAVFPK